MKALRVVSAITASLSIGLVSAGIWTDGSTSEHLYSQGLVFFFVAMLTAVGWIEA